MTSRQIAERIVARLMLHPGISIGGALNIIKSVLDELVYNNTIQRYSISDSLVLEHNTEEDFINHIMELVFYNQPKEDIMSKQEEKSYTITTTLNTGVTISSTIKTSKTVTKLLAEIQNSLEHTYFTVLGNGIYMSCTVCSVIIT